MTVGQLLATISSAELTEWAAYETVTGPLGPERYDRLTALVCTTIAASAGAKDIKPDQFLPQWDTPPAQEQTWEEQQAIARRLLGG